MRTIESQSFESNGATLRLQLVEKGKRLPFRVTVKHAPGGGAPEQRRHTRGSGYGSRGPRAVRVQRHAREGAWLVRDDSWPEAARRDSHTAGFGALAVVRSRTTPPRPAEKGVIA